jgi:chemotaxis protein CheX
MATSQHALLIPAEVVSELVQLAWQSFFGSELESIEPDPIVGDDVVCASISIGGPWNATLLLHCARPLARGGTAAMLDIEPAELADADVHDIMGELANIIGGNLKGVVSDGDAAWTLSLPVVSNSLQTVPGSKLAVHVGFLSDGESIGCQVFEHA